MADNEIVIKARDAAKQTLTQVRKEVSALERELRQASDELERTGQGADKVDLLTRALGRAKTAAAEGRTKLADLQVQVDRNTAATGKLEQAWTKTTQAVKKNADQIQKAGLVAAAALGFVGYKSIDAASDLVESQSKAQQVFGDTAQAILAWSKTANKALGQTQQSAIDGASTFATFGKSAGLTGDQLVQFSTGLVQLSSDMASFYNTSPADAIEAISAAMRGENDPLEKYGVLLNDAVERQEALRLGMIATTSQALTPQQRVLVAQSLIMQKTSDAQGDFARTSDQLANSQRITQAELHDTQAEIGQRFLPVALQLTHVMSTLLGWFGALPGPVQTGSIAVAALGVASAIALPKIITFTTWIGRMRSSSGGVRGALLGMVKSFSPWGVAIGAATIGLGIWADRNMKAKQHVDDLTQSLDEQSGAITENTQKIVAASLTSDKINGNIFGMGGTTVSDAAEKVGVSLGDLEQAILGNADAYQRVSTQLDTYKHDAGTAGALSEQLRGYIKGQTGDVEKSQKVWQQQQDALGKTTTATQVTTSATQDLGSAQAVLATQVEKPKTAAEKQADALKRLSDQMDTAAGKTRSLRSAQAGLEESIDALADKQLAKLRPALTKTKTGFDLTRDSGRQAQQKLFDVADAAEQAASAAADKGKWSQAKQLINEGRDAIEKQAEKWGIAKQDAKKYADTVLGMPKEIAQQITTKVKIEAEAKLKTQLTLTIAERIAKGQLLPNGMRALGDTPRPLGVGAGIGQAALMGIHQKIAASVPGTQHVTSAVRDFALGSPDSDHRFGRAYDVAGSNLGQYASRVRAFGGFAEMHGTGTGRHLHVVPSPGRAVTAVSARPGGSTTVVHAPSFTFPGVTDEAAASRAGAAAARSYMRETTRAANQRS